MALFGWSMDASCREEAPTSYRLKVPPIATLNGFVCFLASGDH
jgi:hypothetical protein